MGLIESLCRGALSVCPARLKSPAPLAMKADEIEIDLHDLHNNGADLQSVGQLSIQMPHERNMRSGGQGHGHGE